MVNLSSFSFLVSPKKVVSRVVCVCACGAHATLPVPLNSYDWACRDDVPIRNLAGWSVASCCKKALVYTCHPDEFVFQLSFRVSHNFTCARTRGSKKKKNYL